MTDELLAHRRLVKARRCTIHVTQICTIVCATVLIPNVIPICLWTGQVAALLPLYIEFFLYVLFLFGADWRTPTYATISEENNAPRLTLANHEQQQGQLRQEQPDWRDTNTLAESECDADGAWTIEGLDTNEEFEEVQFASDIELATARKTASEDMTDEIVASNAMQKRQEQQQQGRQQQQQPVQQVQTGRYLQEMPKRTVAARGPLLFICPRQSVDRVPAHLLMARLSCAWGVCVVVYVCCLWIIAKHKVYHNDIIQGPRAYGTSNYVNTNNNSNGFTGSALASMWRLSDCGCWAQTTTIDISGSDNDHYNDNTIAANDSNGNNDGTSNSMLAFPAQVHTTCLGTSGFEAERSLMFVPAATGPALDAREWRGQVSSDDTAPGVVFMVGFADLVVLDNDDSGSSNNNNNKSTVLDLLIVTQVANENGTYIASLIDSETGTSNITWVWLVTAQENNKEKKVTLSKRLSLDLVRVTGGVFERLDRNNNNNITTADFFDPLPGIRAVALSSLNRHYLQETHYVRLDVHARFEIVREQAHPLSNESVFSAAVIDWSWRSANESYTISLENYNGSPNHSQPVLYSVYATAAVAAVMFIVAALRFSKVSREVVVANHIR